jgi:hypothetical protein
MPGSSKFEPPRQRLVPVRRSFRAQQFSAVVSTATPADGQLCDRATAHPEKVNVDALAPASSKRLLHGETPPTRHRTRHVGRSHLNLPMCWQIEARPPPLTKS